MKRILLPLVAVAALVCWGTAFAEVVAFDDAWAVLGEGGDPNAFYAEPTFLAGFYGLVGGLGNGDPGNWDLEGTNGSAFLGWNGPYDGGLTMSSDTAEISFDVSRSAGSSAGQTFTVEFYHVGGVVGSETVTLGEINTWTTITFVGTFDEVRWEGSAAGFSPYGIDNIVYQPVGTPVEQTSWGAVRDLYR